jgi:hypothetical protein
VVRVAEAWRIGDGRSQGESGDATTEPKKPFLLPVCYSNIKGQNPRASI